MAKLVVGINDLATLHPEVAAEADGWDPSKVFAGSGKKVSWICKESHTWDDVICSRTGNGSNCPYCANRKCWTGFNDLKNLFLEIAKEADGWDTTTVIGTSHQKMSWKCSAGHSWIAAIHERTQPTKIGCPYCSNKKLWVGFNDLKTLFPDVAAEANG
tara:strand:- start:486 stop:959 length:474 start_codon:yes stop_codon:yes gene_type:complete